MKRQENIFEKLKNIKFHTPKIGILGPCGVGKSTLCNTLFKDLFARVEAADNNCITNNDREIFILDKDRVNFIVVDFRNIEEIHQKNESFEIYRSNVLDFDLVLWLIEGGNRNQSKYFNTHLATINQTTLIPLIIVITKIDQIYDWGHHSLKPSAIQMKLILSKEYEISKSLSINRENIISISAKKGYNIESLESLIIDVLSI